MSRALGAVFAPDAATRCIPGVPETRGPTLAVDFLQIAFPMAEAVGAEEVISLRAQRLNQAARNLSGIGPERQ